MLKLGKTWGETQILLRNPTIEMHRMSIAPRKRCSMHMHRWKWNAFLVLSGQLAVIVRKNDYALTDRTVLGPGEIMEVPPGEYHRFESLDQPVDALELYYLEPLPTELLRLSQDIVREDCGGAIDTVKDDQ